MIVLTVCSNSRQASNWFAESTNQGSRMRPSRESIEVLAIRAGRCQEWAFVSAHVISLLRCRLREFLAKKLVMSSLITVTIKFRKKAQGLIFFEGSFWGAYLWWGLCSRGGGGLSTEGKLRFTIDRASLKTGRKFTVFALFCYVFKDNF